VLDVQSHVRLSEPILKLGDLLGPSLPTRRVWAEEYVSHGFFQGLTQRACSSLPTFPIVHH